MTYNNAPMLTEEELDEAIKLRLRLTLLKRGSRRGAPETPSENVAPDPIQWMRGRSGDLYLFPLPQAELHNLILRTEWWETPDSQISR